MKFLKSTALLALVAMLFASCTSSLDEILVKNAGTWNVDQNKTSSYIDGVIDPDNSETITNDGIMTFEAAGTGSWTNKANETTNFNWTYDAEMEQLTVSDDSSAFTYDVIESSNDSQEWLGSLEFEFFGITFLLEQELKLSRQ